MHHTQASNQSYGVCINYQLKYLYLVQSSLFCIWSDIGFLGTEVYMPLCIQEKVPGTCHRNLSLHKQHSLLPCTLKSTKSHFVN